MTTPSRTTCRPVAASSTWSLASAPMAQPQEPAQGLELGPVQPSTGNSALAPGTFSSKTSSPVEERRLAERLDEEPDVGELRQGCRDCGPNDGKRLVRFCEGPGYNSGHGRDIVALSGPFCVEQNRTHAVRPQGVHQGWCASNQAANREEHKLRATARGVPRLRGTSLSAHPLARELPGPGAEGSSVARPIAGRGSLRLRRNQGRDSGRDRTASGWHPQGEGGYGSEGHVW